MHLPTGAWFEHVRTPSPRHLNAAEATTEGRRVTTSGWLILGVAPGTSVRAREWLMRGAMSLDINCTVRQLHLLPSLGHGVKLPTFKQFYVKQQ